MISRRLIPIVYGTANLGLIAYGLLALVRPQAVLADAGQGYLAAVLRLLGYFNLLLGASGLLLLRRYRIEGQAWVARSVILLALLAYAGPVVFDNTAGSIGPLEILEHVLLAAMVLSGILFWCRRGKETE
jgi:hypothetical protein